MRLRTRGRQGTKRQPISPPTARPTPDIVPIAWNVTTGTAPPARMARYRVDRDWPVRHIPVLVTVTAIIRDVPPATEIEIHPENIVDWPVMERDCILSRRRECLRVKWSLGEPR